MRKYVVINSKGGCGKTTIATNLASYYAANGYRTALLDYDPQDSAVRWLEHRSGDCPAIHGVAAAHPPTGNVTRSFHLRVPADTERVILDTPASLKRMDLIDILRGVTAIVVPVLPSTIDSHVTASFIENLTAMTRSHAPDAPIAVVANRVRRNTRAWQSLLTFFESIDMTPVAALRDTQNYVTAAEQGIGIHEMDGRQTRTDRQQWEALIAWLESPDSRSPQRNLEGGERRCIA